VGNIVSRMVKLLHSTRVISCTASNSRAASYTWSRDADLHGLLQIRNHRVQSWSNSLQPQFVGLMHDDEEQLIVMWRRKIEDAEIQQLCNLKVEL